MQDPDCFVGYRKFYIRKFLQHENVLRVDMDIAVDDAELSTDARPQQKHKQAPEDISKLSKEELLELLVTERALQVKRRASREPLRVVTLSSPLSSPYASLYLVLMRRHSIDGCHRSYSCAQSMFRKDLQVERAAHDETAEKMVQLQQRLEVTLQELANLERFSKRQQPNAPPGTPTQIEKLLKEEMYPKSRLSYVQAELSDARHRAGAEPAEKDEDMSI